MAGPVTHIVLALQILHLLPTTVDRQAFIIGTSFPDIRYMAKLERDKTHIEPVSWNDVVNEPSSFRAGMLFHNLVDEVRLQYFEPNFYDKTNLSQYTPIYIKLFPLMLKTAEDAFLYTKTNRWKEIASYFDTIYQEELDFGVPEHVLRTWHEMIKTYIAHETTAESIAQFVANNCDIFQNTALFDPYAEFNALIQSPTFREKMQIFYDTFPYYALQYGAEATKHYNTNAEQSPAFAYAY